MDVEVSAARKRIPFMQASGADTFQKQHVLAIQVRRFILRRPRDRF